MQSSRKSRNEIEDPGYYSFNKKKKEKKNLNLMTRSIIDVFDTEGNKIY